MTISEYIKSKRKETKKFIVNSCNDFNISKTIQNEIIKNYFLYENQHKYIEKIKYIYAFIYLYSKKNSLPLTINDISKNYYYNRDVINAYKIIKKNLGIKIIYCNDLLIYVKRFSREFGLNKIQEKRANEIIELVKSSNDFNESPLTIVGSCIYIVSLVDKLNIKITDICDKLNISENCISKCYRKILDKFGKEKGDKYEEKN